MQGNKTYIAVGIIVIALIALGTVFYLSGKKIASVPQLFTTPAPNYSSFGSALPSEFPDFPVYPGASLIESRKVNGAVAKTSGYSAKWSVGGTVSLDDIYSWYSTEVVKKGWVAATDPKLDETPNEKFLVFTKGGVYAVITIEKGEDPGVSGVAIILDIPLKTD